MQHRKTLMLVLTALFAALTAIGAFFKIPFALAAISLQFLFTAMAGILLGAGYGALSQGVYVLIGLVGVPIFALGGGFPMSCSRRSAFAGSDPVGVCDWEAGEAAPDLLGDGACHAGRAGRSVRNRRAVYGADCKRISGQRADVLASHQKRHADLSAGRSAENCAGKLSMRRHHAAAAAGVRGGLISAFPL